MSFLVLQLFLPSLFDNILDSFMVIKLLVHLYLGQLLLLSTAKVEDIFRAGLRVGGSITGVIPEPSLDALSKIM